MVKLCCIDEKPFECFEKECPHWDVCYGREKEYIEVRIRGKPDFVLECCSSVLTDMVKAKYIEVGHYSPFTPFPVDKKRSGVVYATPRGNIIMDDLSRMEKKLSHSRADSTVDGGK